MKKAAPYILLLIMAALILLIKKCRDQQAADSKPAPAVAAAEKTDPAAKVNRDRGFDRRVSFLKYTGHARCRMECRHISREEVEAIMLTGKINYNKSNIQDARCPVYAVEGITRDNQNVRIVFGQCNEFTNVVTVIDLDTDWSCHCRGDDKKYENRN